ncbi:MAG TPA: alkaline phosphatase PafA [Chitinophagaceae bacterium]|nr:alkaline phosphatase PafA [Chitinophagaceae bacterium]
MRKPVKRALLLNVKVKSISSSLLLLFVLAACITNAQKTTALARPKLVVGIVVDQMRWDYLYRFYDRYGTTGFKRLLNEGFTCENTMIDYVPTVTAIGHSTVYTGSVPAIHGIAGNEFIIEATGKTMYCTEDSTVQTVGSTSAAGKMSARNLLSSTITDELKLATNFRSKVISIAIKDRGSILPAGHMANAAYWLDNNSGNWISSTYYIAELPNWVKAFNDKKLAEKYLKTDWNTLYDIKTYVQSSADDNRYEGKFSGATTTTFPVKSSSLIASGLDIIRSTPYGNTLTLEMAKAAIDNENLGKSDVTDFLALSFSTPDYVGHKFGPNAIETEDIYLRLDKDMGELFNYLDAKVGKGSYTVFLTADHGAAYNSNFLIDNKLPAGFWNSGAVLRDLNALLEEKYKEKNVVTSFSNMQVHLNNRQIATGKLDEEGIRKDIVTFLKKAPNVAFVVDMQKTNETQLPGELQTRLSNGYNYKRSGPITIVLEPGWYSGSPTSTGTTHGSWNPYDAHIPLVWMGWGIKQGATNKPTNMSDIAPTLAGLLRIQTPNGSIGKPIEEVYKR